MVGEFAQRIRVRRATHESLKRLFGGRRASGQQVCPQDIEVADCALAQRDILIFSVRSKRFVDVIRPNPPGFNVFAKRFVGEIAVSADEASSQPHSFLEMHRFDVMQRIVMDEHRHWPVVRNDSARLRNKFADFAVSRTSFRCVFS